MAQVCEREAESVEGEGFAAVPNTSGERHVQSESPEVGFRPCDRGGRLQTPSSEDATRKGGGWR